MPYQMYAINLFANGKSVAAFPFLHIFLSQ